MFRPPGDRERRRDPDECPWLPPDNNNPGMSRGLSPERILQCILPVVEHGIREIRATDPRHAITEVALISYLIGMGFNYNTAHDIVEYWEHENIIRF